MIAIALEDLANAKKRTRNVIHPSATNARMRKRKRLLLAPNIPKTIRNARQTRETNLAKAAPAQRGQTAAIQAGNLPVEAERAAFHLREADGTSSKRDTIQRIRARLRRVRNRMVPPRERIARTQRNLLVTAREENLPRAVTENHPNHQSAALVPEIPQNHLVAAERVLSLSREAENVTILLNQSQAAAFLAMAVASVLVLTHLVAEATRANHHGEANPRNLTAAAEAERILATLIEPHLAGHLTPTSHGNPTIRRRHPRVTSQSLSQKITRPQLLPSLKIPRSLRRRRRRMLLRDATALTQATEAHASQDALQSPLSRQANRDALPRNLSIPSAQSQARVASPTVLPNLAALLAQIHTIESGSRSTRPLRTRTTLRSTTSSTRRAIRAERTGLKSLTPGKVTLTTSSTGQTTLGVRTRTPKAGVAMPSAMAQRRRTERALNLATSPTLSQDPEARGATLESLRRALQSTPATAAPATDASRRSTIARSTRPLGRLTRRARTSVRLTSAAL